MKINHLAILEAIKAEQWDEAHTQIQAHSDKLSCLIHGYLHRLEGDMSNARYWYQRAGDSMPQNSPEEELTRLYELVSTQNIKRTDVQDEYS